MITFSTNGGVTSNMILMIISGLAIILALAVSFYIAYKRVIAVSVCLVCQRKNVAESDVSLDEITEKYIKLTNLN